MTMIGHNSRGLADDEIEMRPGDWIALSRKVREHPIVGIGNPVKPDDGNKGSCSRFEAWFDLLCLAQYRPSRISNKGEVQTLDVGQLMGARKYLASRWNWTEKTVRVFLDTLETEGMISRSSRDQPIQGQQQGQSEGQQRANKCSVISICNYDRYQMLSDAIEQYVRQHSGPAKGQPRATEGPAKGHNLTRKTTQQDLPPYPPPGGEPKPDQSSAKKRGEFTAAETKLSDQAINQWNRRAEELGLAQCRSVTPPRRRRLLGRISEIGGLDQFSAALGAIERVPFLVGKTPPREGEAPFKLDIDRLMQTNGNLGDVLAKLVDVAGDELNLIGPNKKRWGWWRKQKDQLLALPPDRWRKLLTENKPNGHWPWWALTPWPGHPECCMHPEVIEEYNLRDAYPDGVHRESGGVN